MATRSIRHVTTCAALAAAAFLALGAPAAADDTPAETTEGAPAAPKEPKTQAATKGRFVVTLDLSGTFEPKQSWEVLLDAEQWGGELEVAEMPMPGPVQKGAVLAKFKTDKIDEAIAATERDLTIAKVAFQKQSDELKRQEEAQAIAMRRAEIEAENAAQALNRFVEWEKDLRLKEADQRLQQTRDNVADQEEELRQLEAMYHADELTEATEEIVLLRAKRQLERMRFWQKSQETRDRVWRTNDLPREHENLALTNRKAIMDLEKARNVAPGAAEQLRTEHEKARVALARQEENLTKLRRDRALFELTAPESGWAVFGSFAKGKWTSSDAPPQALIAQGRYKVKPGQVLWTIVRPGDVSVRTTVPEASLFSVADGQSAKVRPGPMPRASLAGKVSRVARAAAGTDYEVLLDVEGADPRLMPGQTCKIQLTTLEKDDAVTVPASAVETDGDKRVVQVWDGSKQVRREVETGETSGGRTEILSGVSEGEKVVVPAKSKG